MTLFAYSLLVLFVGIDAQGGEIFEPAVLPPDPFPLPRKPAPIPLEASNTYLVLVGRTIYPGSVLSVAFHFLVPVTSETITATLYSREDVIVSNTLTTSAQDVVLELQIPTSGITWRSYTLRVSGSGSVDFKNETRVYGRPYSVSILIQTDKAIYKPGETVQYRVAVINSALDLIETPLNLEIFDPENNKIDEMMNVQGLLGIGGSLPLSDMPPLGNWRIKVAATEYENAEDTLSFQVKEYVLPKFEVTVVLPSYGTADMTSLKGSVIAKYTFGKSVIGNVILKVSLRWQSGFYSIRAISTSFAINGEAQFEIPMVALHLLTQNLEYANLRVYAIVTETLTDIALEGEAFIRFYSNPYKMSWYPNMPNNFKPGFNYDAMLKVTEQDDRPVTATMETVKVYTTYFTETPVTEDIPGRVNLSEIDLISPFLNGDTIMMETNEYPLGPDGIVQFVLNIPDKTSTASIKAEYSSVKIHKDISRFRSPGEVYLKVEALNSGELKIGEAMPIKLISSEADVVVKYIVQAKDQIAVTGEATVSGPANEATIDLLLTREMAPSSRFVAYYVRPDGEIVADGINIPIADIFENKVTVDFDITEPTILPQASVNLKVTAAPDSMVNVLAVDKSVLLLGGDGNDITTDRVKEKLRIFGNFPQVSRGWGIVFPWSFSADDASDIFNNAQLNVITDANLYRFNIWELDQPQVAPKFDGPLGGGGGGRQPIELEDSVAFQDGAVNGAPPEGQIRTEFPETWIWKSAMNTANGEVVFAETVPDTITEFVAGAFALSPTKGLGVASMRSNLTVFKPFFVNIQLPYSVIRGEIVIIQANVFNYYPEQQAVMVELISAVPNPEFVGITLDAAGNEVETTETLVQCILVDPDVAVPVFFSVRPTIVGSMTVSVKITSLTRNIFDQVIRQLPVKAEGEEKADNYAVLIVNQDAAATVTERVDIVYPPGLVPMSERIRVTLFGDVFGPSLDNLDRLIRMPYGCGEQNMLNFAPAVFAAKYLDVTGRLASNQAIQDKIKNVLQTGYMRELLYKRNDGSFSAFGNADREGSLWLTTFVLKSFAQANGMIFIDPNVLTQAANFILNHQQRDGSYINTGTVHHKAMQGGSAANVNSLTAYVVIALKDLLNSGILTDVATIDRVSTSLTQAGAYLVSQLNLMTTDYEAAIGAWALKMIDNTEYTTLLQFLDASVNKTAEGYWDEDSAALEIEIVSYVLMVYTDIGDTTQGLTLLKWLVKKRSPYGGFISTQDTVVALQALSSFAALIYSPVVDLTVELYTIKDAVESERTTLTLTEQNHDILQYVDYPGDVEAVMVIASGSGLGMVDVNVLYNVIQDVNPIYSLSLTVVNDELNRYTVEACASFNRPDSTSNMAIMDVGGLSGFVPSPNQIETGPIIKRVEVSPGGNRLIIYFDQITAEPQCVNVTFQRSVLVANVKPAVVLVYSYYEPEERAMLMYIPESKQTAGLCNTCGTECGCGPIIGGTVPIPCDTITNPVG